ncbi:MAG: plastocyanin/azurin family copper-binding protein [Methyloceanibacter sp.]|uniref:plastocyanin/azurin family copper-binding protein n=1 Tax=Methyloceanibacter sp. TaxID=1965321 RepID=UPI003EE009F4
MSLHFIRLSIAVAAPLAIAPAGALAAEHVVKMLNDNGKGEYMVFEPSYIEAAPGDTVKFVAVDQFHNAETMPEIWPEGAATFQGELSKDVTLTIEEPGVYGIKCQPHWRSDFTITIERKALAMLEAAGLDLGALPGKLVRVRGFIEWWNGPMIAATHPEQIEVLAPASPAG